MSRINCKGSAVCSKRLWCLIKSCTGNTQIVLTWCKRTIVLNRRRKRRFCFRKFSWLFSAHAFVRNGEFFSPFCTTSGQHSATISGGHSFSETMLVFASSVRRLECSFHLILAFVSLKFWGCKNTTFFETYNTFPKNYFNSLFKWENSISFCLSTALNIDNSTTFANTLKKLKFILLIKNSSIKYRWGNNLIKINKWAKAKKFEGTASRVNVGFTQFHNKKF